MTLQRRIVAISIAVGITAVALAMYRMSTQPNVSREEVLKRDGYVLLGSVDATSLWAKRYDGDGKFRIAMALTGKSGELCNATGPDDANFPVCNGSAEGKIAIALPIERGRQSITAVTSVGEYPLYVVKGPQSWVNDYAFGIFGSGGDTPVMLYSIR